MHYNKIQQYQYILFDLDGTLTDSAEGITNSVRYALEKNSVYVNNREELLKFIGPPLTDSFMKYYGFESKKALELVQEYREYYSQKGLFENKVYAGIQTLLEELKAIGKSLVVATSKPEEYTKQILEYFDLTQYFDFIAGATMDESRIKKEDVIRYALRSMNIVELDQVLMVGDRHHDIDGAKVNKIDSLGVLYGFGNEEELKRAGATYIVESVEELKNTLIGINQ